LPLDVYLNGEPINNEVVQSLDIPLIDTTYDNLVTLPTTRMTVIFCGKEYAVGDQVTITDEDGVFTRFEVREVEVDYRNRVKILDLADPVYRMRNLFVKDFTGTDLQDSEIDYPSEDFNGVTPIRYNVFQTLPYRSFVTMTHVIKMCVIKAGIITDPLKIDCSDLYGEKVSGFWWYDNNGQTGRQVYLELLAFNWHQLKMVGRADSTDKPYHSMTLDELFRRVLQVLNAEYRWKDDTMIIQRRKTGMAVAVNDVYDYSMCSYRKEFDYTKATVYFVKTVGEEDGFGWYVSNYPIGDERKITSEEYYPEAPPEDEKLDERAYALAKHFVGLRRKRNGGVYSGEELDFGAGGLTDPWEYSWARQYARVMAERHPDPDAAMVETVETVFNPTLIVPRSRLKLSVSIPANVSKVEY